MSYLFHPFSDADIDAAYKNMATGKQGLRLAIFHLWKSAVARGAVEETYSAPGPNQRVDAYIIKLPEDKT